MSLGDDGRRTKVEALTSAVEGKRTARRQLAGSQCAVSQETALHLCQRKLQCLLFLLFPNPLCLVLCATAATDSGRKLNWEKMEPLGPRLVTGNVLSLPSWRVSVASSAFHTSW